MHLNHTKYPNLSLLLRSLAQHHALVDDEDDQRSWASTKYLWLIDEAGWDEEMLDEVEEELADLSHDEIVLSAQGKFEPPDETAELISDVTAAP